MAHATPNAVHGTPVYWLSTEGRAGRLVGTSTLDGSPPTICKACGRNRVVKPIPPVAFATEDSSGHDVCWSADWFGGSTAPWRALVVRASVVDALRAGLGPVAAFSAVPVERVGPSPARVDVPGTRTGRGPSPPVEQALDSVLDEVAARAGDFGHTLFPPVSPAAVLADFRALGLASPPPDVVRFYSRTNGVSLFAAALDVAQVVSGAGWIRDLQRVAESSDYPRRAGWVFFAGSKFREMLWTINEDGDVRGVGPDGIVYGPGVTFTSWLTDQLSDLSFLWARRDDMRWAGEYF